MSIKIFEIIKKKIKKKAWTLPTPPVGEWTNGETVKTLFFFLSFFDVPNFLCKDIIQHTYISLLIIYGTGIYNVDVIQVIVYN